MGGIEFLNGTEITDTIYKIMVKDTINSTATLTVIKKIINDDGGNLTLAGVTLKINGTTVTNNTKNIVTTGPYLVSESPIPGYIATFSGDCDAKGKITLTLGQKMICIITNDDIRPPINNPMIKTNLSRSNIFLGSSISDSTKLLHVTPNASGTVTYNFFMNNKCTGKPLFTDTEQVKNGIAASSAQITPTILGHYNVQVIYSGDDHNKSAVSHCGNEQFNVKSQTSNN
jgi:hypothetical protein